MRNRRRWVLASVAVAGVCLGLLGVLAALRIAAVSDDLRLAKDLMDEAAVAVEEGRIGDGQDLLDRAYVLVVAANNDLHASFELRLLERAPVVSQNLTELRRSVGLGLDLVVGGREIIRAATPLADDRGDFQVPLSDGALPLDVLEDTRVELARAAAALRTDEPSESKWLFGPVRTLRDEVRTEADRRSDQFGDVARALEVVNDMAGAHGPRTYLIAVANNAEMRGSGGMILNYGVLRGADGDFELGAFGRIDEVQPADPLPPATVDLPADYLRRWEGFDVTHRWRNVNMAADLTLIAPTMLDLYESATGERPDGVIQIDPVGLSAILEGTGPVTVPEIGEVGAENVVDVTLNEAYVQFPDIDERTDVLGDVAELTFDKLVKGDYPSLRPLAEAVIDAAAGRHLLFYAERDATQDIARTFGVTGELPPETAGDHVHLSVQNISANKLDYHLDSALYLTGERPLGRIGDVRARISLRSNAPAGVDEPVYVFGPNNASQVGGFYRGVVTLYVPRGTDLVGFEGSPVRTSPTVQSEDGRTVVSFSIEVPPETERVVSLDLRFPPRTEDEYRLLVTPSSRVRDMGLAVDLDLGDGHLAALVSLTKSVSMEPEE